MTRRPAALSLIAHPSRVALNANVVRSTNLKLLFQGGDGYFRRTMIPKAMRARGFLLLGSIFLSLCSALGSAHAAGGPGPSARRVLRLDGVNAHGANYFNGQILSAFHNAAPYLTAEARAFWRDFYLVEVGAQDSRPEATTGAIITPSTPRDALMATIDSGLLPVGPALLNLPIHDTPIIADLVTSGRRQLPVSSPSTSKLEPVRNARIQGPITLRQWEKARGRIRLSCAHDGTGWVRIRASSLLPGIPYTVWAVFATDAPTSFGYVTGNPLGGVPNIFVPDDRGRAVFERELSFCPLETREPLMYVALFVHWDGAVYGAIPDAIGQGFPIGVVGGDQLLFLVGDNLHRTRFPRR